MLRQRNCGLDAPRTRGELCFAAHYNLIRDRVDRPDLGSYGMFIKWGPPWAQPSPKGWLSVFLLEEKQAYKMEKSSPKRVEVG